MSLDHIRNLKTKTGAAAQLAAAKKAAEDRSKRGSKTDDRFWKPTFDKEKQYGSATVRFLPSIEADHADFAMFYHHSFKGATGKWYIENCLTTLNNADDPCVQLCSRLWSSGIESDKELARKMKRKINYIANVLVIKDPANREAEGKVFMWKFGQQVMDCLNIAMQPKEEDDEPIAVFNPFLGAPFKIEMHPKEVNGDIVQSYEKSRFMDRTGPIADDEDEVLEICGKAYKLSEFDTPGKEFKTYEELQRKLFEVLGPTVGSGVATVEGWETAKTAEAEKPAARTTTTASKKEEVPFETDDDTDAFDVPAPTKKVEVASTASAADLDPELAKILLG